VPNLDKRRKAKTATSDEPVDKQSDDYVLSKLFKRKKKHGGESMIHTALHHDKIVNNSEPDFALIEIEAEKVANEAVKALKESRKYCSTAESGRPNLVGIKFGAKLKIDNGKAAATTAASVPEDKSTASGGSFLSSKSLLDRIKMRNEGIRVNESTTASSTTEPSTTNKPTTSTSTSLLSNSNNPIDRTIEMSKAIHEYLTKSSVTFNRATTEQIVDHFRHKLDTNDTVKFRAVLKRICDFKKSSTGKSSGYWSLKDEYL
jgi:DNA excision repair protein ERCC-6